MKEPYKDPYEEVFEEIGNTLKKLSDMVVFVAKHTMTVNDFEDFIEKFRTDKRSE